MKKINLLGFFGCLAAVLSFSQACKTQQSSQAPHPDTLRVMTYNIHHANPPSRAADSVIDLRAIAKVIIEAKADLVALQEVDRNTARSGSTLDEAEALGRLTGMHFYYSRSMDYRGGQYGNAVLSRFLILDTMHFELPPIAGSSGEVRSVGMAKVQLPGKRQLYFASTHLDVGRDERSRLAQAEKIIAEASSLRLPVILGGDFNSLPESRTIALFDEAFSRVCVNDCPFTIPVDNPKRTIDFIMVRPAENFRTLSVRAIPETYASDHLPVVAELVLTAEAGSTSR